LSAEGAIVEAPQALILYSGAWGMGMGYPGSALSPDFFL